LNNLPSSYKNTEINRSVGKRNNKVHWKLTSIPKRDEGGATLRQRAQENMDTVGFQRELECR
jgi:hypothetical protein